MDVVDKHRELNLCFSTGSIQLPFESIKDIFERFRSGILNDDGFKAELSRELESNSKFVPTICFRDFGRRKLQSILPASMELHNYVVGVVQAFSRIDS